MFKTSFRAKIKSKFEELKRRWERLSTLGKIKMCLFNYFVFILLASFFIVCIALPDFNDYGFPLFLLIGFYGAFYDPPGEPVVESEESLIIVFGKKILLTVLGILFVIGIILAL